MATKQVDAKPGKLNFDDLSRNISLDENRRANNIKIMNCVLDKYVIPALKKDKFFELLYREIRYTGSYYDGLKTKETDEFDLNIVLRMPFREEDVMIIPKEAGYSEYTIRKSITDLYSKDPRWDQLQKLEKIFDSNRCLSPAKTMSWLQGLNILIPNVIQDPTFKKINIKIVKSGPAWTLKLTGDKLPYEISIDLVGAIELPRWPNNIRGLGNWGNAVPLNNEDKLCMLIPKGPNTPGTQNYFRISMPFVERKLLNGKECVKPLIRLFKVLRDKQQWQGLASYYIKTMFLWEIEKHLDNKQYWYKGNMEARFYEMLEVMRKAFYKRQIPNFFFPKHNLAANVGKSTFENMYHRLDHIIKDIQKNPGSAGQYF